MRILRSAAMSVALAALAVSGVAQADATRSAAALPAAVKAEKNVTRASEKAYVVSRLADDDDDDDDSAVPLMLGVGVLVIGGVVVAGGSGGGKDATDSDSAG